MGSLPSAGADTSELVTAWQIMEALLVHCGFGPAPTEVCEVELLSEDEVACFQTALAMTLSKASQYVNRADKEAALAALQERARFVLTRVRHSPSDTLSRELSESLALPPPSPAGRSFSFNSSIASPFAVPRSKLLYDVAVTGFDGLRDEAEGKFGGSGTLQRHASEDLPVLRWGEGGGVQAGKQHRGLHKGRAVERFSLHQSGRRTEIAQQVMEFVCDSEVALERVEEVVGEMKTVGEAVKGCLRFVEILCSAESSSVVAHCRAVSILGFKDALQLLGNLSFGSEMSKLRHQVTQFLIRSTVTAFEQSEEEASVAAMSALSCFDVQTLLSQDILKKVASLCSTTAVAKLYPDCTLCSMSEKGTSLGPQIDVKLPGPLLVWAARGSLLSVVMRSACLPTMSTEMMERSPHVSAMLAESINALDSSTFSDQPDTVHFFLDAMMISISNLDAAKLSDDSQEDVQVLEMLQCSTRVLFDVLGKATEQPHLFQKAAYLLLHVALLLPTPALCDTALEDRHVSGARLFSTGADAPGQKFLSGLFHAASHAGPATALDSVCDVMVGLLDGSEGKWRAALLPLVQLKGHDGRDSQQNQSLVEKLTLRLLCGRPLALRLGALAEDKDGTVARVTVMDQKKQRVWLVRPKSVTLSNVDTADICLVPNSKLLGMDTLRALTPCLQSMVTASNAAQEKEEIGSIWKLEWRVGLFRSFWIHCSRLGTLPEVVSLIEKHELLGYVIERAFQAPLQINLVLSLQTLEECLMLLSRTMEALSANTCLDKTLNAQDLHHMQHGESRTGLEASVAKLKAEVLAAVEEVSGTDAGMMGQLWDLHVRVASALETLYSLAIVIPLLPEFKDMQWFKEACAQHGSGSFGTPGNYVLRLLEQVVFDSSYETYMNKTLTKIMPSEDTEFDDVWSSFINSLFREMLPSVLGRPAVVEEEKGYVVHEVWNQNNETFRAMLEFPDAGDEGIVSYTWRDSSENGHPTVAPGVSHTIAPHSNQMNTYSSGAISSLLQPVVEPGVMCTSNRLLMQINGKADPTPHLQHPRVPWNVQRHQPGPRSCSGDEDKDGRGDVLHSQAVGQTVIVESEHNCRSGVKYRGCVLVEGASSLTVKFDPRCMTGTHFEFLCFYADANFTVELARFAGPFHPSKWSNLTVGGNVLFYSFQTRPAYHHRTPGGGDKCWGYQFTVVGSSRQGEGLESQIRQKSALTICLRVLNAALAAPRARESLVLKGRLNALCEMAVALGQGDQRRAMVTVLSTLVRSVGYRAKDVMGSLSNKILRCLCEEFGSRKTVQKSPEDDLSVLAEFAMELILCECNRPVTEGSPTLFGEESAVVRPEEPGITVFNSLAPFALSGSLGFGASAVPLRASAVPLQGREWRWVRPLSRTDAPCVKLDLMRMDAIVGLFLDGKCVLSCGCESVKISYCKDVFSDCSGMSFNEFLDISAASRRLSIWCLYGAAGHVWSCPMCGEGVSESTAQWSHMVGDTPHRKRLSALCPGCYGRVTVWGKGEEKDPLANATDLVSVAVVYEDKIVRLFDRKLPSGKDPTRNSTRAVQFEGGSVHAVKGTHPSHQWFLMDVHNTRDQPVLVTGIRLGDLQCPASTCRSGPCEGVEGDEGRWVTPSNPWNVGDASAGTRMGILIAAGQTQGVRVRTVHGQVATWGGSPSPSSLTMQSVSDGMLNVTRWFCDGQLPFGTEHKSMRIEYVPFMQTAAPQARADLVPFVWCPEGAADVPFREFVPRALERDRLSMMRMAPTTGSQIWCLVRCGAMVFQTMESLQAHGKSAQNFPSVLLEDKLPIAKSEWLPSAVATYDALEASQQSGSTVGAWSFKEHFALATVMSHCQKLIAMERSLGGNAAQELEMALKSVGMGSLPQIMQCKDAVLRMAGSSPEQLSAFRMRLRGVKRFSQLMQHVMPLLMLEDTGASHSGESLNLRVQESLRMAVRLMLAGDKQLFITSRLEPPKKGRTPSVQVDRFKALQQPGRRGEMSILCQIMRKLPIVQRKTLAGDQWWTVQLAGEPVSDAGGGFRDSVSSIASELSTLAIQSENPMFIEAGSEEDGRYLVPNPSCEGMEDAYQFLGQVMGACVHSSEKLAVSFPHFVWSKLLGSKPGPSWDDYAAFEPALARNYVQIEENAFGSGPLSEDDWEALGLDFTLSIGKPPIEIELCPGGRDASVGLANRREYVELARGARMRSYDRQVASIRKGLLGYVPHAVMMLWNSHELEAAVAGEPNIPLDALWQSLSFSNVRPEQKDRFKACLEKMDMLQRSALLRFGTGRSRLPCKMKVSGNRSRPHSRGGMELPTAATCSNQLNLPSYASQGEMMEALLICTQTQDFGNA
mmetsp:Transcript_12405/g.31125  ORF Transcript_12405/g.31125 Transcript_12405/m.31125 type:complete len:2331 (+) Transcript_12405:2-6994(+)